MAVINLLPRKEFEITLNSGEIIKGKFSLWSVKRYCDKRKLTLQQLETQLKVENAEFEDICQMVLCAVEDASRREKKGFAYTDQDVCDWIEEMGGLMSDSYAMLMNHARSEDEEPAGEKKTEGQ